MNESSRADKWTYIGLFIITLATLMYEILLTRIFSVTMWYHFAFLAVSVTMFGMTLGAIIVYLLPDYFKSERAKYHMALSSLWFAITLVLSFMAHLSIPFVIHKSIPGFFSIAFNYAVISIPFIFSGICVTLALTKFPRQVSRLYAADLVGAALGCILLVYTIGITGGPTAAILIALLISIGTIFFSVGIRKKALRRVAVTISILLGVFVLSHSIMVQMQMPLLRLMWVKGAIEFRPLYEKWNSFSRVVVDGNPEALTYPHGWGMSPTYPSDRKVRRLYLDIDAGAGTHLTAFDGDLNEMDFLKYDVTNVAYYLIEDGDVLVVGVGGGRDVLSALVFGQKSVVGVEINEDIIKAVNKEFGDFTGHLDQNPKVKFINDEARSYIARIEDRFDIIQVSMIDTYAATAAGAFVLSESGLYTIEAWTNFLEHLTSKGILTFSRWYFRDTPASMYRLTALAVSALKDVGIEDPRDHIIIVRRMYGGERGDSPDGVGTILVGRSPFTVEQVKKIEDVCQEMEFSIVLTPEKAIDPIYEKIASGEEYDDFIRGFPMNINPPTDNSPFFFHMLKLRNIFNRELWSHGENTFNMKAVVILGILLIVVTVLTLVCIIVPLLLTTKKEVLSGSLPLSLFFASIGFGFMLIEISQMQRLVIFLGHPIYSLSVVLFSLLLSCGLGSYLTRNVVYPDHKRAILGRVFGLLCVLVIFGLATPSVIRYFQSSITLVRIIISIIIIFPLGLFMGMMFPMGMKIASAKSEALTPWLWGLNGATSVCASVIAIVISINTGIASSFWTGFACYLVALLAFFSATRRGAKGAERMAHSA